MMPNLTPCECGGQPDLYQPHTWKQPHGFAYEPYKNGTGWIVHCEACHRATSSYRTMDDAAKAWNTGNLQ